MVKTFDQSQYGVSWWLIVYLVDARLSVIEWRKVGTHIKLQKGKKIHEGFEMQDQLEFKMSTVIFRVHRIHSKFTTKIQVHSKVHSNSFKITKIFKSPHSFTRIMSIQKPNSNYKRITSNKYCS